MTLGQSSCLSGEHHELDKLSKPGLVRHGTGIPVVDLNGSHGSQRHWRQIIAQTIMRKDNPALVDAVRKTAAIYQQRVG